MSENTAIGFHIFVYGKMLLRGYGVTFLSYLSSQTYILYYTHRGVSRFLLKNKGKSVTVQPQPVTWDCRTNHFAADSIVNGRLVIPEINHGFFR